MHINMNAIIAVIVAGWITIKKWWNKMAPILTPLIQEAEQLALAGKIDKAARKQLVMDGIKALQTNGIIKLNWLEMLLVGRVVDYIAGKLPDFDVSQSLKNNLLDTTPTMKRQKAYHV